MTTIVRALGIALLFVASATAGIESLLPAKTEIARFTCRDLLTFPQEGRERALIYLSGVADGRRQATVFEAERWGTAVDRVLGTCRARPEVVVIDAFAAAWR